MPTSSDYHLGHTVDTTPGVHLTTVAPTPAAQQTTMADPIVMTGDLTATMVGRTGKIGHIETGHIETIGHTVMTGHTTTIVGVIGMTILTIARGAGLATVPDITVVAGIMTTWRTTRAAFL